jgi:hypothetical protein
MGWWELTGRFVLLYHHPVHLLILDSIATTRSRNEAGSCFKQNYVSKKPG